MFRIWTCVLAVALLAATADPALFHAEHSMDQDCTICAPRNQPLVDLSHELQVRPTGAAETLARAPRVSLIASHHGSQIPARAPPLSIFPAS